MWKLLLKSNVLIGDSCPGKVGHYEIDTKEYTKLESSNKQHRC